MPASKRHKKVSLTKVKKQKTGTARSEYIDGLRSAIEAHSTVFVVEARSSSSGGGGGGGGEEDMVRPTQFKAVREAVRGKARVYMGKHKIMQLALGMSEEDALKPDLHLVARALKAGAALIMTDEPRASIAAALDACAAPEFANAGFVPATSLTLERGRLPYVNLAQVAMQETLKKLGLAVEVVKSKLVLMNDFTVHSAGKPLTAAQAKLLTHLDMKLDRFHPKIVAAHENDTFTTL